MISNHECCVESTNLDRIAHACTSIKILGIYFDYHKTTRRNLNFSSILKSSKKTLNMWRWRGLTLLGRIQIVKTFAKLKLTNLSLRRSY